MPKSACALDGADSVRVFPRHEVSEIVETQARGQPFRQIAVLHPERHAQECGRRPGCTRFVRVPRGREHGGLVDRDKGIELGKRAGAVQKRRGVGLRRDVAVTNCGCSGCEPKRAEVRGFSRCSGGRVVHDILVCFTPES